MDSVPNEVLVHILSFLPLADRLKARLVCQRWCDLVCTHHAHTYAIVIRKPRNLQLVRHRQTPFHLIVKNAARHLAYDPFWEKSGKLVTKLALYDIGEEMSYYVNCAFPHTRNVRHLVIVSPSSEELPPAEINLFPKLSSLIAIDCKVNGAFCQMFLKNRPYLQSLRLSSVEFLNDPLLPANLTHFSLCNGNLLKELDFSFSDITDQLFSLVIEHVGPQFSDLLLEGCKQLGKQSLVSIKTRLPNLKLINLEHCSFGADELHEMFTSMHNLEQVFVKALRIKPATWYHFLLFPNLKVCLGNYEWDIFGSQYGMGGLKGWIEDLLNRNDLSEDFAIPAIMLPW